MKDLKINHLQTVLYQELSSSILKKIDEIKEKMILQTCSDQHDYLQILAMVDDDLDDVLLNWETSTYTSRLYMSEDDMLSDEDDLEYD